MKYMLLIYQGETVLTDAERQACYVESAGIARDLAAEGRFISANPLQSISTATSVRVRNGKSTVTDGPFAETREQLGGFYIIEAKDLDEAIAVANRIPPAAKGTIEIRPVMEIAGLPEDS